MNICGLISGNFKRHLKAAHRIEAPNLYGEELSRHQVRGCLICTDHAEALRDEMKKVPR